MKNSINMLLAAVLLVLAVPTAQAQQTLNTEEAQGLLNKMLGQWQISYKEWQPETQNFQQTEGNASFRSAHKGNYLHEVFELVGKDGKTTKGEGFMRYSEAFNRFEFVQLDESGKSTLLLTGRWYPEFKMVSFTPVEPHMVGSKKSRPRWDYFFFEDGTFKKVKRTTNKQGVYMVASESHYVPNQTAIN